VQLAVGGDEVDPVVEVDRVRAGAARDRRDVRGLVPRADGVIAVAAVDDVGTVRTSAP
jgi:hypothetical protein